MASIMKAGQVLTRRDTVTGQPLYDYRVRKVIRPSGSASQQLPDGSWQRYDLVETIIRRYEVA